MEYSTVGRWSDIEFMLSKRKENEANERCRQTAIDMLCTV